MFMSFTFYTRNGSSSFLGGVYDEELMGNGLVQYNITNAIFNIINSNNITLPVASTDNHTRRISVQFDSDIPHCLTLVACCC
jgi:hypothetical protein